MSVIVKICIGALFSMGLTIFGAMLTTDYKALRSNGESYLPALGAGLASLGSNLSAFVSWPPFYLTIGGAALVTSTFFVTRWLLRPKRDPWRALGYRMETYRGAVVHDQRYRRFSTLYNESIPVARELEAFMVEIGQQGLSVPCHQSDSAPDWIDICGEYLAAVGPYLRADNLAHAMAVSKQVAERYPRRAY